MVRTRHTARVGALAGSVLLAGVLAAPATADEDDGSGTVSATVTVAEPDEACLTLSDTLVDFGTLDFGESGSGDRLIDVVSCSEADQDLLGHGTDAVGDQGAEWALDDFPALNAFAAAVRYETGEDLVVTVTHWLTTTPDVVRSDVPPGATRTFDHRLRMPDEGSDGAGEQMSFDIIWTAVLAE